MNFNTHKRIRILTFSVLALVMALGAGGVFLIHPVEAEELPPLILSDTQTNIVDIKNVLQIKSGDFKFIESTSQGVPTITLGRPSGPQRPDGGGGTASTSIRAGVNFLVQNQNADGSWQTQAGTEFLDTIAVTELLELIGSTTTPIYASSTVWVNFFFPHSNAYTADKAHILSHALYDERLLVEALVTQLNQIDGGFGFEKAYASDAVTTAKVLRAITASGYQDPGPNPNLTLLSTLVYLINTQHPDGGWGEASGLPTSVFATAQVLEALEPYKTFLVSGLPRGNAYLSVVTGNALSYLQNTQMPDGTWNNDLLDTALSYRMLNRYGTVMTFRDAALSYILAAQAPNGSFGNGSYYITAKVLQALVDANLAHPDLAITSVTPTTLPLENGTPETFDIRILNEGGETATGGMLYIFVDDFFFGTFNLTAAGVSIAPGTELSLLLTFNSQQTERFVNATELRWYIETTNESDYADNWASGTFTFAVNSTGVAALHVFYVARAAVYSGIPAVTMEWANKQDTNKRYNAFLFRPQGAVCPEPPFSAWCWRAVDPASNNATLYGFPEGGIYEVTAGVYYEIGPNGFIRYDGAITTVKTSVNPNLYPGSVEGFGTVNNASTSALTLAGLGGASAVTNASGAFSVSGAANGSNAFWVDDPLYEKNMTKAPVPANGTTTGVRVFTRLKEDTAAPVITNFEVVGEGDFTFPNQTTVTLSVSGTDNEIIKEADFRLFDPGANAWTYLGTAPFTPAGTATTTMSWFVPITVLGPGYQLEATLQDYQNNFSLPAFWGPFTVTPGNAVPTITITQPSNATTTADETFVIEWTDDDPDSDATISLYYDTNNTGEDGTLIVSGLSENSPLDRYTWRTLPVPDGSYYIYGVIGDGHATTTDYSSGVVTLVHINDPPVAANDLYSTLEDVTLSVATSTGVLANDFDIEGDPLTVVLVTNVTNGALTLNPDGSFSYEPRFNWNGTDLFTYMARDRFLNSNVATATITVSPVNDPPTAVDDAYVTNEDIPLIVPALLGVLANDMDPDGNLLTAILETNVATGTLALLPDGSFSYTSPHNWNGIVTFTYVANDGSLNSNVATATITVNPVNDPPTAVDDLYVTDEDIRLSVATSTGVLANDTDPEGNSLTAVLVTTTSNGALTLNADGSFSYEPSRNWNGTDFFAYMARDGEFESNIATATITVSPVNDPPTAADDAYETDEDVPFNVGPLLGVLANDTDPEGNSLSAILQTNVATGTLVLLSDGSFNYTAPRDWNGVVTFTYVVNDGLLNSNIATATITVNPVNDPPVAADDAYSILEDILLSVATSTGVLVNDTDPEGDPLTAVLETNVATGTLAFLPDGSFTYQAPRDWNGVVFFTYRARDGEFESNIATVTITVNPVNDPPTAVNDVYATNEAIPLVVNALTGVLANDTDVEGDPLTAVFVTGVTNGRLTLNPDGSFIYTPFVTFFGTDTFTYRANDGLLNSNVATVTITVNHVIDPRLL